LPSKNGQTESPSLPQESLQPGWEDIYAELRNKLRWAIGTTTAETGVINLSYRSQTAIAGILAQDTLSLLKAAHEKPDLHITTENARKLLTR